MSQYDVIIIGLGGAGAATLDALAMHGKRVLGLESRATLTHWSGCSHSPSRGYRQSYNDPLFRQLAIASLPEFQRLTPSPLHLDGAWLFGPTHHPMLEMVRQVTAQHQDTHWVLDRVDGFSMPENTCCIWEEAAGWIDGLGAISAWIARAKQHGADIALSAYVHKLVVGAHQTRVVLADGQVYEAPRVVLCTGGLRPTVVDEQDQPIAQPQWQLQRQAELWFEVEGYLPMFHILQANGSGFYGMCDAPGQLKVALHDPHSMRGVSPVHSGDVSEVEALIEQFCPGVRLTRLSRIHLRWAVMTPDRNFCIGPHPKHETLWWFGGLCGHGFKMLPTLATRVARGILAMDAQEHAAFWTRFMPKVDPQVDPQEHRVLRSD